MDRPTQNFEYLLAFHCAPALAGIKAADLISWQPSAPQEDSLPRRYDAQFAPRGIRVRELCRCPGRRLLLVYRPDRLARWLAQPQVEELLARAGYPVGGTLEELLQTLAARLGGAGDFPHEVGLFLGYPPADVEGFCRNGGRNFKLAGPWKVYDQVEEAQARFCAFRRCRSALCRRVEEGRPLAQLFPAAG